MKEVGTSRTMNNIIIIRRNKTAAGPFFFKGTRPRTLPMRLFSPAQNGRCRTIADGAQVVPSSHHVSLLYVTIHEVIFQFCHPLIIKYTK